MVKTPIKVIVRTRPTVEFAYKNIQINENTGHIAINIPKSADQGKSSQLSRIRESSARRLGLHVW